MDIKEYELRLNERFKTIGLSETSIHWAAMAGESGLYSPKVDIAVGPFATGRRFISEYDEMASDYAALIDLWIHYFRINCAQCSLRPDRWSVTNEPLNYLAFSKNSTNENARCFIALEIENKNSRKHFMGSLINVGALGRIGLFVAWRPEVLRAALRLLQYFEFLQDVGKPSFNKKNILVLTHQQMAHSVGFRLRNEQSIKQRGVPL